ncbi:MAG: hypothetical protein EOP61_34945 [Sphingomonadales bacterium]|nr:MAG: hypothetical protein EOP61_34945 [Sphingomonadales bacterium]
MAPSGTFEFSGWAGPKLRVFYQLPKAVTADTPVLIAIHGVNRDADNYRDEWARHAIANGFIVVAPEFNRADFPDNESFSSGGMEAPGGGFKPREQWAFAALDPLFDAVKARTGSKVPRYILYGHSGGAQFVQRFVLFMPGARYLRAIAANAGWYTMADFESGLPYGLKGSPIGEAELQSAFKRRLWILLGSKDIDPRSPNLRITKEAMKQGAYRLARGDNFFNSAQAAAAKLGTPFNWQRRYVNGVGHDNVGMSAAAAALVMAK